MLYQRRGLGVKYIGIRLERSRKVTKLLGISCPRQKFERFADVLPRWIEDGNSFRNVFLDYQTMDKVQKVSNPELCHITC
jgi:hypothetical protein